MLFGLDGFTLFHVALSLIGVASGFVVLGGLLAGVRLEAATVLFLVTTAATSLTGFGFPFNEVLPSHVVGAISLVVLAVAAYALYGARLAGPWRWVYVASATASLYLNVFVLIVQTFLKNPTLAVLAPTQSELPFVVAQGATLLAFLLVGFLAVRRFGAGLDVAKTVARTA